jgi:hypothetical protein
LIPNARAKLQWNIQNSAKIEGTKIDKIVILLKNPSFCFAIGVKNAADTSVI